ncbi:hypothetical protein [Streptomyces sp. BPTC-684]|uniref:hypothetical protein n=1 Tax=Streptomyces sp. BPTC-684 TaxID=3043734 RepID=UPI0024B06763|nr:hypothetical protein [Streptomyces sp. BPTC-684]WHM41536.1 hypothetical protein QIY60_32030 [Streptomyces sp. BPTC-684]
MPTAPPTGEITVHRCTVTVVRRGGWSWGPDPRGLVRQVIDSLPELLADHFAEHLSGDGPDVEITEPVTVTVRPGGRWWSGSGGVPAEVHFTSAPVVAVPSATSAADAEAATQSFADSLADSLSVSASSWSVPSAAALFAELAERDELDALLALLPDDSVRAYALALLGTDDAVAARLLAELAGRALPARSAEALPEPLRARLSGGGAEEVTRLLVEYVASAPREDVVRLARSLPDAPEETVEQPMATDRRPAAMGGAAVPRKAGETRVWSALPFLLVGPLARIGYLDAIGPALAGVECAEDAPLFAAALAYKVLGMTERGWRRTERDSEAAAVFAGLDAPVPEERLTEFARLVRPALAVLDGVLALSVCRGHDPADPLLLTGTDDRLLLVDAQGMFPIAWAERVSALLPYWQTCGRPPVLICDGPLPSGTLRELAAAGVPFLTGIRPLRGDPVARVPWRTPLWTAEGAVLDLRLAAQLPGHAARLADLVDALAGQRRAVPLARDGALERSVTLAAGLGLSTIAWTLWRERETPDPVLALTRFADLDATVRFEPEAVRVRVPLGRRHADLLRGGLLADVPDVVWLGGRALTFSGG